MADLALRINGNPDYIAPHSDTVIGPQADYRAIIPDGSSAVRIEIRRSPSRYPTVFIDDEEATGYMYRDRPVYKDRLFSFTGAPVRHFSYRLASSRESYGFYNESGEYQPIPVNFPDRSIRERTLDFDPRKKLELEENPGFRTFGVEDCDRFIELLKQLNAHNPGIVESV